MKMLIKFLTAVLLVVTFGCGSAGPVQSPPPTTGTTGTATSTSTGTNTPPPPLFTAAQKQTIIDTITSMGGSGVELGLDEWAKSNSKVATEVATALHANIANVVLPVLNGQNVNFSAAIQSVSQNLYVNIPPLVQLAIEGAGAVIDQFKSIPGVQDSDMVDFVKAFVTAVDNGCQKYIANPPAIGSVVAKHSLAKSSK